MKKTDISNLGKISDMIDEDLYWLIIQKSLKKSDDQDEQEELLIKSLTKLSPQEIIGFRIRTDKFLQDTYTSEMWCAGYIMNGGCSDDGFEYFRNWVISRGKEIYYKAKENPDSLIETLGEEAELDEYEFESFWHVADETFEVLTGQEIYEYIDNINVKKTFGDRPEIEFNWKEEEPETLKSICPRLFDLFWEI